MANPEEAAGKGKEDSSSDVGPILRLGARLPDGKVKTGLAKAAVTAELIKGNLTMDASVEPGESDETREPREIEDPTAEPRPGFVERRQAEETAREEMIARLGAHPPVGSLHHEHQAEIAGPKSGEAPVLADTARGLSGRALSGNIAPIIPVTHNLPPRPSGYESGQPPTGPGPIN